MQGSTCLQDRPWESSLHPAQSYVKNNATRCCTIIEPLPERLSSTRIHIAGKNGAKALLGSLSYSLAPSLSVFMWVHLSFLTLSANTSLTPFFSMTQEHPPWEEYGSFRIKEGAFILTEHSTKRKHHFELNINSKLVMLTLQNIVLKAIIISFCASYSSLLVNIHGDS